MHLALRGLPQSGPVLLTTIASPRKHMAAAAPEGSMEQIEGHLLKEGHSMLSRYASWKKRLFVLRVASSTLDYYDDGAKPRVLKGSIKVGRGARVLDAPSPDRAFVVIAVDGTKFPLQAECDDDKARWMRTISAVSAGNNDFDVLLAQWNTTRTRGHVAIPVDAGGAVPRARTERRERRAERKARKEKKRDDAVASSRKKWVVGATALVFVLWLAGVLPWRPKHADAAASD